jgi:hypothetical protein
VSASPEARNGDGPAVGTAERAAPHGRGATVPPQMRVSFSRNATNDMKAPTLIQKKLKKAPIGISLLNI